MQMVTDNRGLIGYYLLSVANARAKPRSGGMFIGDPYPIDKKTPKECNEHLSFWTTMNYLKQSENAGESRSHSTPSELWAHSGGARSL